MTTKTGYLLIADISGYTQFLTSTELEHANPILQSLLGALVEQVGDPLHLWKMDGDAVLAYSTDGDFPSGETFLTICENLYTTFATHRQNIIANTTCPCKACANVNTLDLKIMAHYGTFNEMQVGPIKDISGPDVILVHRMAKTEVTQSTGVNSYALFSDPAVEAMGIEAALMPFSQSFEHFGEVSMKVYDLARAWEKIRAGRERFFLREQDGVWTYRRQFNLPAPVVWQALTSPQLKQRWMQDMNAVTVENPDHRVGHGSAFHCAHDAVDFYYNVIDWEPFVYFSAVVKHPARPGVTFTKTYQFVPTDSGTELRYTIGKFVDADGAKVEGAEAEVIDFLSNFWPASLDNLGDMIHTH